MKPEQIIYDDKNAAKFVENIKGWVDINNRFFGNNSESEHMARWSSCTHLKCECGNLMTKGWTKCDKCRAKAEIERYNLLPFKPYNNEYVYSDSVNKYFWSPDEIEDYCLDNDINAKDLRLVFCDPVEFQSVDSEYWEDCLPEEGELPQQLQDALDLLNKVISELPPASYKPGKIRTEYLQS